MFSAVTQRAVLRPTTRKNPLSTSQRYSRHLRLERPSHSSFGTSTLLPGPTGVDTKRVFHDEDEVKSWTTTQVLEWAKSVPGVLDEDVEQLRVNRITGDVLFSRTEQDFRSIGIPLGPAAKLVQAIEALKTPTGFDKSSPANLAESILRLFKEKGIPIKEDLYTPLPLLRRKPFKAFVSREESLQLATEYLTKIHYSAEVCDDRWKFPIIGTRGGPGTGKTAFVDAIAQKLSSKEKRCLVISVSYNGYTRSRQDLPLSSRVLYYAFSSSVGGADWANFVGDYLKDLRLLDVLRAIESIAGADHLVLCVDEISKASTPDLVLSDLTECRDAFRKANDSPETSRLSVFVTSLDGILGSDFTNSGRLIYWIGLPLLKLEDVRTKLLTQPEWKSQPIMNLLIQLSSGYPRILQALKEAYPEFVHLNPKSLEKALGIVTNALRDKHLLIEGVKVENIAPTLLGMSVTIKEPVPYGIGTYATLIENGTLVRPEPDGKQLAESTEALFVPMIPLLPLYIWASKQTSFPAKALYQFMDQCVYATLIGTRNQLDSRVFQGEGFELIHAWYSVLRIQLKHLIERKSTSGVFLLSPINKVSNMKQLMDPLLKTKNELDEEEKDVEQKLTHFLEICCTTPDTTVVLHLGGNFPGTDILVFQSNSNCVVSLSLQQCKYKDASAPFTATDLNNCLDQVKKNWEAYGLTLTRSGTDKNESTVSPLPFGPLKNLRIHVELFIFGKVATSLPRYDEVKVHGEDKLKHLYGPTLFPLLRPSLD